MSALREPAATLRHPVVIVALAVWALNDHVLKGAHPGWLTGKLSDVCGLVVAPALLVSLGVLVVERRRGRPALDRRAALAAALVVGVAFAAIQVWAPAGDAYRVVFGLARWPLDALAALVGGGAVAAPGRVELWPDATDLLVLPALAVPVVLIERTSQTRHTSVAIADAGSACAVSGDRGDAG